MKAKIKPLVRGVFSGWFFPTGTRSRVSFFLSLLITFIIYSIIITFFLLFVFASIFMNKGLPETFFIIKFLVLLFSYICIILEIQRLRDIGINKKSTLIIVFIVTYLVHYLIIYKNIEALYIVAFVYFISLFFCPGGVIKNK